MRSYLRRMESSDQVLESPPSIGVSGLLVVAAMTPLVQLRRVAELGWVGVVGALSIVVGVAVSVAQ